MAKNLATFVKGILPAGTSSGPSETMCRVNVYEFVGSGGIGKFVQGPGQWSCEYCKSCGIFCVPNVDVSANNGGEALVAGPPNKAKFEIWGAGGFVGGLSNCGIMPPSGSAAYAYKTIDVTGGSCYLFKVGYSWCCRTQNSGDNTNRNEPCGTNSGATNYHTHVSGTNLTNFCAEGGWGSHANCCNFNSTYFDSDERRYYTSDKANTCGCSLPQYYGADGGANGMQGYITKKRCADATKTSSYLQHVPYPGGTIDKCGGHLIWDMARAMPGGNVCCTPDEQRCYLNAAYGMGASAMQNAYNFGQGGVGYHLCGGSTVCGGPNYSGRLKITYWRE